MSTLFGENAGNFWKIILVIFVEVIQGAGDYVYRKMKNSKK